MDTGKVGTYWLPIRLRGIQASTTLAGDLFDQPYLPPTQEMRRFWAKRDAKFQTRTGHVPHQVRPTVRNCQGVLLTWKVLAGIGNLRTQAMRHVLEECFRKGKDRFGFQLINYSILSNHIHLIVTVPDDEALRKGAHGLGIRIGKASGKYLSREGRAVRDRYHAKPMYGKRAIRNAVTYVLQNARKHKIYIPDGEWDIYSSARFTKRLVSTPPEEWPIVQVCFIYGHTWAALRGIRPDVFPGHLALRA